MAITNVNTPIAGVGAQFQRWNPDASPDPAWEAIAEITNITGPSASREMIDVTALNTTGGYRKFIGSFRDTGTINTSMNFTNEGYTLMKSDFESAAEKYYQICLLDAVDSVAPTVPILGTSLVFPGLVQELPLTVPTDAQVTVDIVIKATGKFEMYDVPEEDDPTP